MVTLSPALLVCLLLLLRQHRASVEAQTQPPFLLEDEVTEHALALDFENCVSSTDFNEECPAGMVIAGNQGWLPSVEAKRTCCPFKDPAVTLTNCETVSRGYDGITMECPNNKAAVRTCAAYTTTATTCDNMQPLSLKCCELQLDGATARQRDSSSTDIFHDANSGEYACPETIPFASYYCFSTIAGECNGGEVVGPLLYHGCLKFAI